MDEALFTKGFNDGYSLEKDKPDFMNTLIKGITIPANDNVYIEGLKEGQKQRQNERERERISKSIDQNKERKSNDRNLGR